MKIVVVHNTYQQPGGEDVAVAAERDLLESHGRTVIRYSRINDEIATTSGTRRLLMVKDIIHSGRSQREMLDLLRSERPDLVHVHNTFMMVSRSMFEACREAGIPAVQTLNNYKLLCPGGRYAARGRFVKNVSSRDCGEAYGTLAIAMRTLSRLSSRPWASRLARLFARCSRGMSSPHTRRWMTCIRLQDSGLPLQLRKDCRNSCAGTGNITQQGNGWRAEHIFEICVSFAALTLCLLLVAAAWAQPPGQIQIISNI